VATGISRRWVQGEIQFILWIGVVEPENDMGHDFDNTLCVEGLSCNVIKPDGIHTSCINSAVRFVSPNPFLTFLIEIVKGAVKVALRKWAVTCSASTWDVVDWN